MRFATLVLLTTSILCPSVAAQTAINDWNRISSVASGSKLSVKLKTGKTVDGTLTSVSDSALSLMVKKNDMELKREDVASVHHVIKKSAAAATLIGAGVGAGTGAAIGAATESNDDDSFVDLGHEITAGLAVVGAGVGAVTGWLVGRNGTKRLLIYEAK